MHIRAQQSSFIFTVSFVPAAGRVLSILFLFIFQWQICDWTIYIYISIHDAVRVLCIFFHYWIDNFWFVWYDTIWHDYFIDNENVIRIFGSSIIFVLLLFLFVRYSSYICWIRSCHSNQSINVDNWRNDILPLDSMKEDTFHDTKIAIESMLWMFLTLIHNKVSKVSRCNNFPEPKSNLKRASKQIQEIANEFVENFENCCCCFDHKMMVVVVAFVTSSSPTDYLWLFSIFIWTKKLIFFCLQPTNRYIILACE